MKAPPDEPSTCAPADPTPRPPTFTLPAGAVDCHAHVFLDPRAFPFHQPRSYTPPPALLEAYCAMHRTLGIARGVLVQPSVYGDDNSAQANALVSLRGKGLDYRGVAVVRGNVTDVELDRLGRIGFCGVRLNLLFEGDRLGRCRASGVAPGRAQLASAMLDRHLYISSAHPSLG
ncbi:amidohydrolase family protein [Pseudomonas sp. ERGC3:05]|nr:amidohydrolase family protein [Pseudomonas sp. ERGC3:05]